MKIGFLINARMGSTRLPDKHLKKVNNKTFLEILISRIKSLTSSISDNNEKLIILATSTNSKNLKFKEFLGEEVLYGTGPEENVPLRQLEIANTFGLDGIVNIDGDDILIGKSALKECYVSLTKGIQLCKTTNLPLGMNAMGYSKTFLEKALDEISDETLDTNWSRLFKEEDFLKIEIDDLAPEEDKLRFTLDYQEDADFFKEVIKNIDPLLELSDNELVKKTLHSELYKINQNRIDEYWENFYSPNSK